MKKDQKENNWISALQNPHLGPLKKYIYDMLKDKYFENENIIDRIGVELKLESDMKAFAQLIFDSYQAGFEESFSQYKNHLKEKGYKPQMKQGKKEIEHKPIFPQENEG